MGIQLSTANDNFLKCLPKSERQGLKTAEEIAAKREYELEGELHRDTERLLRLRGIWFVHGRFGKKIKDLPKGFPDFQVILPGGIVGFIELKTLDGKLSDEQKDWQKHLVDNGHNYCVATDLEQVRAALGNWGKK